MRPSSAFEPMSSKNRETFRFVAWAVFLFPKRRFGRKKLWRTSGWSGKASETKGAWKKQLSFSQQTLLGPGVRARAQRGCRSRRAGVWLFQKKGGDPKKAKNWWKMDENGLFLCFGIHFVSGGFCFSLWFWCFFGSSFGLGRQSSTPRASVGAEEEAEVEGWWSLVSWLGGWAWSVSPPIWGKFTKGNLQVLTRCSVLDHLRVTWEFERWGVTRHRSKP